MQSELGASRILTDSLRSVLEILDRHEIPYAAMGGIALQAWGRPRSTRDLDLAVSLKDISEEEFTFLLEQSGLEFQEALQVGPLRLLRFLWGDPRTTFRVEVDFFPTLSEYQETALGRALWLETPFFRIRTTAPEDLILQKLASGRAIDLYDVEELFKEQGEALDRKYLNHWADRMGLTEQMSRIIWNPPGT